jgi:kynurenine formamidase
MSPGNVTAAETIDAVFDITEEVMNLRRRRFAAKGPQETLGRGATGNPAEMLGGFAAALLSGDVRIVDCTGALGPDTPILRLPEDFARNTPKVEINKISEYDSDGPFFAWNWLKLGEHSGTHFDAPHHWISGKDYEDGYTDTIDVQRLIAPVNVIDCSAEAASDPDFLLTADHVKAWESKHGAINPGEWVLMRTDWDKRSNDEKLFLNEDPDPYEDGSHSPGPTTDCIDYLLSRGIVGWGTQCIGTDAGMAGKMSPPYPAHNFLHRDNCFGLASLINLDQLPPKGAILVAAPLKIKQGTGSPIRALALVPRN